MPFWERTEYRKTQEADTMNLLLEILCLLAERLEPIAQMRAGGRNARNKAKVKELYLLTMELIEVVHGKHK